MENATGEKWYCINLLTRVNAKGRERGYFISLIPEKIGEGSLTSFKKKKVA